MAIWGSLLGPYGRALLVPEHLPHPPGTVTEMDSKYLLLQIQKPKPSGLQNCVLR